MLRHRASVRCCRVLHTECNTLRAGRLIAVIYRQSEYGSRRKPTGKTRVPSAGECCGHSAALHVIFISRALSLGEKVKCYVCPESRAEAGAKHPVKNIPEVFYLNKGNDTAGERKYLSVHFL